MCSSGRITLGSQGMHFVEDWRFLEKTTSWLHRREELAKFFIIGEGGKIMFAPKNVLILSSREPRKEGQAALKISLCIGSTSSECRAPLLSFIWVWDKLKENFLGSSKISSNVLDLNNYFLQHVGLARIKFPNVKKEKFSLWMATLLTGVALHTSAVSLT